MFTSVDDEQQESRWDLDPVEFDSADDSELYRYLIESFWLLRISPSEVKRACTLFDKKVFRTPVGELNERSINEMGSLGAVLIEIFNRIQTIDTSEDCSRDVLQYLNDNLMKIDSLPSLPKSVRNSLHGCQLTYREIAAEVELKRFRREMGES